MTTPCFNILNHQKKATSVCHLKQIHQQHLSDQKYLPQPGAAKTLEIRLGTDLLQDILLLRIPPLLFLEKRKLENDVDYKINKLSSEPSFSRKGLAQNRVKYDGNFSVQLDSTRPGISASHASNNSAQVCPL